MAAGGWPSPHAYDFSHIHPVPHLTFSASCGDPRRLRRAGRLRGERIVAAAADWNLELVRARRARDLLPKKAGSGEIDWGDVRVAHLDTGFTRHPILGFGNPPASWLQPEDGLNLIG